MKVTIKEFSDQVSIVSAANTLAVQSFCNSLKVNEIVLGHFKSSPRSTVILHRISRGA